jgi:hypothetical protein
MDIETVRLRLNDILQAVDELQSTIEQFNYDYHDPKSVFPYVRALRHLDNVQDQALLVAIDLGLKFAPVMPVKKNDESPTDPAPPMPEAG